MVILGLTTLFVYPKFKRIEKRTATSLKPFYMEVSFGQDIVVQRVLSSLPDPQRFKIEGLGYSTFHNLLIVPAGKDYPPR